MDGVIRKCNSTLSSLLQYACPKQNMDIAVNRADVPFRSTSYRAISRIAIEPWLAINLRSAQRLGVSVFQRRSSQANEMRAPCFFPRNAAEARRWVSTHNLYECATAQHEGRATYA
jgi:hypothetical protein